MSTRKRNNVYNYIRLIMGAWCQLGSVLSRIFHHVVLTGQSGKTIKFFALRYGRKPSILLLDLGKKMPTENGIDANFFRKR